LINDSKCNNKMKQPVLFTITIMSLAIALAGLFMKWKGYVNGDILFFVGLAVYLVNRIAFYRKLKK